MRPILAVLALTLPAAVHAQFVAGPAPAPDPMPGIVDRGTLPPRPSLGRELGEVRERIGDGRRGDELTKRQARGLRRDAGMIATLADRYAADGLSDSERHELDMRIEVLRTLTAAQRLRGRSDAR